MKYFFRKKSFFIIFLVCVFLLTTGLSCTKGGSKSAQEAYQPTRIVYWSVWNDEDVIRPLITAYRRLRPNVTVEYRKLRFEDYENELIEAMADGRGPDIFSIHNTWMQRYQGKDRLLALPSSIQIPVKYTTGTIQKEEVIEFRTTKSLTALDVKNKFLDFVADDAVYDNKVYGLPIYSDNLAMFYNVNLLRNAGIIEPPTNWSDFQDMVKRITKIDAESGNILVSGAALGTADNIPRSFDILSLLMMQNLAPMLDSRGRAAFNKRPAEVSSGVPAVGALEYYVQFASPLFEAYCWNSEMPNALEAFADGRVGFFFGYSYHRDQIDALAPGLNYAIAPVPQVGEQQKINYASYWLETVSSKTENSDYAWDFVQFISNEDNVAEFLTAAKRPTALKSTQIINQQLADEDLYVFADQLFTADSWYRGNNVAGAETAFAEMIDALLQGELSTIQALNQAVDKVDRSIYE